MDRGRSYFTGKRDWYNKTSLFLTMRFELPFNADLFRRQLKLLWKISNRKTIPYMILFLTSGILLIALGYNRFMRAEYGFSFSYLALGLYNFIAGFQYLLSYWLRKRKYEQWGAAQISRHQNSDKPQIWEFTGDRICYSDAQMAFLWSGAYSRSIGWRKELYSYRKQHRFNLHLFWGKWKLGRKTFNW